MTWLFHLLSRVFGRRPGETPPITATQVNQEQSITPDLTAPRMIMVVARGRASAAFRKDEHLHVAFGDVHLTFRTRYRKENFAIECPEDVWVEITGSSVTLNEAARKHANLANGIAAIIAFACNAAIDPLEVELAFDSTSGKSEREFLQVFVPDRPLTSVPGRHVEVPALTELLKAVVTHSETKRLRRAISQYSEALRHWTPGSELNALSHLFMGIEALKTVTLREHLATQKVTREQLAVQWGFDASGRRRLDDYLNEEARRRLIFQGDTECHRQAKSISDKIEHGFDDFSNLWAPANDCIDKTARYFRECIISILPLNDNARQVLLSPPYSVARGPLRVVSYLRATLVGQGDDLAAPDRNYPIFNWKIKIKELFEDPKTQVVSWTPEHTAAAVLAKGAAFTNIRLEIWDGSLFAKGAAGATQTSEPPTD